MKLIPKIDFVVGLYAHIENLAVYHKWSSKGYPRLFQKSLESKKARNYIKWYRAFRKKHFIDWAYDEAFTSGNFEDAFKNLKHLKKSDIERLREIFIYFNDDYLKIWNKNKDNLKSLKKSINLWWKEENHKFIRKASFITSTMPKQALIFLFWNPLEFKATAFGKSSILIETNSNFPVNHLLEAIPHELGHLIDISYGPDSLSFFKKQIGSKKGMIMHEAVIRTLFPAPKPTSKITNIKNLTDRKIENLSIKFKPILKSVISANENYRSFLLRTSAKYAVQD